MKQRFETTMISAGDFIVRDTTQTKEGLYVISTSARIDVANAIANVLEDNAKEYDTARIAYHEMISRALRDHAEKRNES